MSKRIYESVGKTIREARLAQGLTQEQLAEVMFVSRQVVSKWELGQSFPSPELLVKLCEELNIDIGDLYDAEQRMDEEVMCDEQYNIVFDMECYWPIGVSVAHVPWKAEKIIRIVVSATQKGFRSIPARVMHQWIPELCVSRKAVLKIIESVKSLTVNPEGTPIKVFEMFGLRHEPEGDIYDWEFTTEGAKIFIPEIFRMIFGYKWP